uniref:DNA damage-binding protein 1 n=1 Tax=Kwoniella dejecticola CBS 10117 TaxID=1296121 RepID=A0A1A5ZX85_9TREE|nr:uncharacterized protein I303_07178 [Kwoniella dejecticola CBS 10117]OBR82419.1 hypothetical protein I303_07178 [Kwoniella dejecticola CBS 10117]
MLYIASALTPTPIIGSLKVEGFTGPESTSLIIAKPDKVEVWNVEPKGLVYQAELELWGNIVGIDKVEVEGARPHFLVLTAPPSAHLLLITYSASPTPALIVTSTIPLNPPTPTLRQAEFFTSVVSQGNVALVSLWIGVLSCIEMEVEKDKDARKRRASAAGMEVEEGKRLQFRDNFNINVREHNLLHLSFLPVPPTSSGPLISFLWLSAPSDLQLQVRTLSTAAHAFNDLSKIVDVVAPLSNNISLTEETNFNHIPFSCPAARRVLPIPSISSTRDGEYSLLVIGDEHSVLYNLGVVQQSPKALRRLSIASGPNTSPRASARRSPQTEMVNSVSKRRKSSMNSKATGGADLTNERWELKPVWRVRQGFGTILAASILDSNSKGASAIIGDECGRLTAIGWEFERNQGILEGATGQNGTVRVKKVEMGVASPPSSLTYLDSSHLFISSAAGDSSVVKLNLPEPNTAHSPISPSSASDARAVPRKGKGRARDDSEEGLWTVVLEDEGNEWRGDVDIKERWMNVAPVKDLCAVQEEGGGLSHLVISSGASNTNSLRVVRSGVGLEEVSTIQGIEGVEKVWTLVDSSGSPRLLLSTSSTTLLLQMEPEISLLDTTAQISDIPTLAAGILPGADILVQITARGIATWSDVTSGLSAGSIDLHKESEIVAAQVYENLAVIAKAGGEVNLFEITANGLNLVASLKASAEIASISIISSPSVPSPILAIGTWSDEILVYSIAQIQAGSTAVTSLTESHYASSLHLQESVSSLTSTSGVQLLAGLSDGSLVVYDLEPSGPNGEVNSKSRKVTSLGNRPLNIEPTTGPTVSGDKVIGVGLTERMSVIFESGERIDTSSVSRKDVICATSLNSPTHGEILVLVSSDELSFVKINSLKKLSISTLDLGDRSATKIIAYNEHLLVDGVVVKTMDAQNGEVLQMSSLELRDSVTLNPLAEMQLKEREEVTSLRSLMLNGKQYLAVGTAILPTDEEDGGADLEEDNHTNVKEGRLLLIDIVNNTSKTKHELKVVVEKVIEGPVYDLEVIHGFLAVAAGSKVTINRLSPSPQLNLVETSSFTSAFLASHLTVTPATTSTTGSNLTAEDRLVLGDGLRSIIVLSVDEGDGKIYDDTRDLATHAVNAMGPVTDDGEGVIIGDGYNNIMTFRLKDRIEPAATFGLHEEIIRFVPGSLAPPGSSSDVLRPDQLYMTATGRLGIIGELTKSATRTLDDLQRNLDKYWRSPLGGGVGWKEFRKGGSELVRRDMAGWVDGDFVQKFLNTSLFTPEETDKVLNGSTTHEQVHKIDSASGKKEKADRADVVRVLEAAGGMH